MNNFNKFCEKHLNTSMLYSVGLSVFNFVFQFCRYMQDGELDNLEMNELMSSSSGLQVVMLTSIYLFMRFKQKK